MASDQPRGATSPSEQGGPAGVIAATGAIVVVGLGLVFVFIIAVVSLGTVPGSQKSTVVASAFTVIGTVVGTYFGVRAGSAGKERAEAARDLESMKVQELAARVEPTVAQAALDKAEERAETVRSASSATIPAL
jgi:threonine/homoserine/homoserine lactone efflux protein